MYQPGGGPAKSTRMVSAVPGVRVEAGTEVPGSPAPCRESPSMSRKTSRKPCSGGAVPQQQNPAYTVHASPGSGESGENQTPCTYTAEVSGGASGGAPGVTSPVCHQSSASGASSGCLNTDIPSPGSKGIPSSPSSSRSCQTSVSTGVPQVDSTSAPEVPPVRRG
jgi:hypothetical protein